MLLLKKNYFEKNEIRLSLIPNFSAAGINITRRAQLPLIINH